MAVRIPNLLASSKATKDERLTKTTMVHLLQTTARSSKTTRAIKMGETEAATTTMAITQTEIVKTLGTSSGIEMNSTTRCQLTDDRNVVRNVEIIALSRGTEALKILDETIGQIAERTAMIRRTRHHKILEETTSERMTDRKSKEITVASVKTDGMTVHVVTVLKTINKAIRRRSHNKPQLS